jgi:very-short-patch-repair endonuclease
MRKLTTEEFIKRSRKIHNNIYDYSLVDYKNNNTKVSIICKNATHSIFLQTPQSHLSGNGCKKCHYEKVTPTTEKFIEKAKQVKKHQNRNYDYSLTEYKRWDKKILIICKKHGVFKQRANSHLRGNGCYECWIEDMYYTQDEFIKQANKVHKKNKYNYSLVVYRGCKIPIKIVCRKKSHGTFKQMPQDHLQGNGCCKCNKFKKLTQKEFVEKSSLVHGKKYDYSKVKYKNSKAHIIIVCHTHGKFEQLAGEHMAGEGCPSCNNSKGENKIKIMLDKYSIKYIPQNRFDECRYKRPLPFDFYLPKNNICIEFDGRHHFEAIEQFGGKDALVETKKKDMIKTKFCRKNKIKLIRIKYTENIEQKLSQIFSNAIS